MPAAGNGRVDRRSLSGRKALGPRGFSNRAPGSVRGTRVLCPQTGTFASSLWLLATMQGTDGDALVCEFD